MNQSNKELNAEFIRWINQQPVNGWAKITLEYPYYTKPAMWNEPLKQTFAEIGHTYPKSSLIKKRKNARIPPLHFLGFMGGDFSNGKALHFHGLVEVFDNDLIGLKVKLEKAWLASVNRSQGNGRSKSLLQLQSPANVWVKEFHDSVDQYFYYMQRYEGNELGFGVEKIVLPVLALSPYQN